MMSLHRRVRRERRDGKARTEKMGGTSFRHIFVVLQLALRNLSEGGRPPCLRGERRLNGYVI